MRRLAVLVALAAVFAGACGTNELTSDAAQRLQRRVAEIRAAAENGRPVQARLRLQGLATAVAAMVDQGLLDEGRAAEIIEAADAVRTNLSLVQQAPSTESPSPSVVEEEGGNEGEGEGEGGKGKDKGKGNGEGNGND